MQKSKSTPERSPAGGSRLFPKHRQHQLERRGIAGNTKALAAGQHQLDGWNGFRHGLRLHEREADRRVLFPQPLAPPVEGVLLQPLSQTVCADRLAAGFLLCDPLTPQLAPLLCFGAHFSTVRLIRPLDQWGSCDAYRNSTVNSVHDACGTFPLVSSIPLVTIL